MSFKSKISYNTYCRYTIKNYIRPLLYQTSKRASRLKKARANILHYYYTPFYCMLQKWKEMQYKVRAKLTHTVYQHNTGFVLLLSWLKSFSNLQYTYVLFVNKHGKYMARLSSLRILGSYY